MILVAFVVVVVVVVVVGEVLLFKGIEVLPDAPSVQLVLEGALLDNGAIDDGIGQEKFEHGAFLLFSC